ncbi:hypothetical protein DFJ74DRAFT_133295 [Hyaloraphidium curvatum]|nr:hypothetical protein DFJ74DRAFT_133295 [Hyaloraphidium curvatum]
MDLADVFSFSVNQPEGPANPLTTAAVFLMMIGGGTRSTLVPFYDWLPETAEAPTPVSALLHAGTFLTKLFVAAGTEPCARPGIVNGIGVFGLLLWPVFRSVPIANYFLLTQGVLTALFGIAQARVRADVKGRLAASTTSQMGYLAVQVALGLPAAAFTHLVGHGLWKAGLFLQAGGAVERVRAAPDHHVHELKASRWLIAAAVSAVVIFLALLLPGLIHGTFAITVHSTYDIVAFLVAWFAGTCALVPATTPKAYAVVCTAVFLYVLGAETMNAVVGNLNEVDGPPRWAWYEFLVIGILVAIATAAVWMDQMMRKGYFRPIASWVAQTSMPPIGIVDWFVRPRLVVPDDLRKIPALKNSAQLAEPVRSRHRNSFTSRDIMPDVMQAMNHVAPVWPLASFVASNPLAGLEDLSFRDALAAARRSWGSNTGPDAFIMRRAADEWRIGLVDAVRELAREPQLLEAGQAEFRVAGKSFGRKEFLRKLALGGAAIPAGSEDKIRQLVKDWIRAGNELEFNFPSVRTPLESLCTQHRGLRPYDELARTFGSLLFSRVLGDPAWPATGMDGPATGIWDAFRYKAAAGAIDGALGLTGADRFVRKLPASATNALQMMLEEMGAESVGVDRPTLLARYLAREPGWPAHVAWRVRQNRDPKGGVVEILAVRVALEAAILLAYYNRQIAVEDVEGERAPLLGGGLSKSFEEAVDRMVEACEALAVDPAELRPQDVDILLAVTASVDPVAIGQVRFRILEEAFRGNLIQGIHKTLGLVPPPPPPDAQVVFCIDVRSGRLRRQLEHLGRPWETFGAAGFFGLPLRHVDPRGACSDRCPALLIPDREVIEAAPSGPVKLGIAEAAVEEIEVKAVAPFAFAEAAGWITGPLSLFRTLLPPLYDRFFGTSRVVGEMPLEDDIKPDAVAVGIEDDSLSQRLPGFSVDELVGACANFLNTTGFTSFSPLVVLCGHGASVANNPHVAAYDCGACGGFSGDVSSRAMCEALNSPRVRAGLAAKGISIPADTHFTPAVHDTTRDLIHLLEPARVPERLQATLKKLEQDLATAADASLIERFPELPGAPITSSLDVMRRHVAVRAVDWGQPRPEWGLCTNACMVIGPRHLTSQLKLNGRSFLQSYEPSIDTTGAALTFLMTAPLVVGHWISSQYLMSTIDPDRFGAGDKTTHDVVCAHDGTPSLLTGVLTGVRGDIRIGLPWQAVSATAPIAGRWVSSTFHEPVRLFGIIYAKTAAIDAVLEAQESIGKLVRGEWLHICSIDPETKEMQRRMPGGGWKKEEALVYESRESLN